MELHEIATDKPRTYSCFESDREVRSQVYDPNGHPVTLGYIVEALNTMQPAGVFEDIIADCAFAAAKALDVSLESIEQLAGETGRSEQSHEAEASVWLDGVAICINEAFAPVRKELVDRLNLATDYQCSWLAKNKEHIALEYRLKLVRLLQEKWEAMSTKYMPGDIRGPLMGQMAGELKEALGL